LLLIVLGVWEVLRGNLIGGVWQFLIGMFLRAAASASYQQTMAQRLLADVSVGQVMTPDPIAVPPDLSVARFVEDYVYRYHHREFPVAHNGRLLGRIGTAQAAMLDRDLWPLTKVATAAVACTPADIVSPETRVLTAIAQMSGSGRSRLFVVRDRRLVGVVSQRDLMELLSAKLELSGGRNAGPRAPRRWADSHAPS